MICFHYFLFFCFFTCKIMQLNAFDEEQNDLFAELWQKSEEIGTKSGKCEETLRTNANADLISQKIGKIKKEIVVKDEPNDYEEFDHFSNERKQKMALNKTVKEENVEKRVKSEFMEFDRFSDKEEFDNGKDGEKQSTESYSIFDNSNLKESSSKSQKEVEKQEIIAEFDKLKKEFKGRFKGMPYAMINEKIAQKLGVALRTINLWKNQLGVSNPKKYTDAEKVELLKKFYKIKKENPQLRNFEIAKTLNIHNTTLNRWERESRGLLEPGIRKSEVEKQEMIAEFDKLRQQFKTLAKGMSYDIKKLEEKIAKKLGVSRMSIYRWKKQFGASNNQKKHTKAEKAEFVKQFYKIEKENPKMNNEEIAQLLNIPLTTINRWKEQFLQKVDNGGPIDNVQRHGGSERSTSSANSLNDIPWKWNVFRKKRNGRIGKIPHKC